MRSVGVLAIGLGTWCTATPARAQALVDRDLHGETPPAPSGDPARPWLVPATPDWQARTVALGALAEFADGVAVRYDQLAPGAEPVATTLVGQLAAVNLSAAWGWGRRAGLEASWPLFAAVSSDAGAAPAVGDLRLRVPVALVDGPASLGVLPTLSLPTGSGGRQVGGTGAAGALITAGLGGSRARLDGSGGLSWSGRDTLASQTLGGPVFPLGAAVGLGLSEAVWLHGELRATVDPGAGVSIDGVSAALVPSEAFVSLSGGWGRGVWGGAGGTAIGGGAGAARFRALAGGAVTLGWGEEAVETPVGAEQGVVLRIVDASGAPVADASVRAGGIEVGRTDAAGQITVARTAWAEGLTVEAPGMLPAVASPPGRGQGEVELQLAPFATPLDLRITDLAGGAIDATVVARSTGDERVLQGRPGELMLPVGAWTVSVSHGQLAGQRRGLVVAPGERLPGFDVVLAPVAGPDELTLEVVDVDGAPVAGARVLVDGVPVGTSSSGEVGLDGLVGATDRSVEVRHDAFTTAAVQVPRGESRARVVLQRVPGSVRVVAVGASGAPVTDAAVRFLGPSRLSPAPLGPHGERVQVLGPGSWDVLVTSPTHGAQRRRIDVDADDYALQTVEVVLREPEGGVVDLSVQVLDPSGQAVDGAEVLLNGASVGSTGTGGSMLLSQLDPGARQLQVRGEFLRELAPRAVDLVEGLHEEVVLARWVPGATQVRVVGPEGPVSDATVRLLGSENRVLALGSDGVERVVLAPGTWTVLVTSPTYGAQRRGLVVEPDSDVLHQVEVVLRPPEGGLAELAVQAVDPDGLPVAGVELLLDGVSMGRTGPDGGLVLEQLATGSRDFQLRSDRHVTVSRQVRLLEGRLETEERLEWAPGAVRVSARGPDGPVTDAVVRFLGPTPVRPGPVDGAGRAVAKLVPGVWQALVSSPTMGVAQASFEVVDGAADLIDVEVVMARGAVGTAELAVRAVDEDGRPVEGAKVVLGGVEIGETGRGGVFVGQGLRPAESLLVVVHPDHEGVQRPLTVKGGSQERVVELPWKRHRAEVEVVDRAGAPVAAELTWRGPDDVPAGSTDGAGRAEARLRPGTWEVIASSGALGPARTTFEVGHDDVVVQLVLERAQVEVGRELIAIKEQVLFDFDSAVLRAEADPVLDQVASALLGAGAVRVEVQGHTDATGAPAYNQGLSQARADSVLQALVVRGVPREMLVARGYGPQRPLAGNDDAAGRSKNRRVQFEILERGVED